MVAKFLQPNYNTQGGTAYPLSIDASIAVLAEQAAQFAVSAQDTPNMTVAMRAARLVRSNNEPPLSVAAQSSAVLTAPAVNPRNDIVYYDETTGVIGVAIGTEAATPADPSLPAGKVAAARLRMTVGMTSISNSVIEDLRQSNSLPPPLGRMRIFTFTTNGGPNGTFTATHTGNYLVMCLGGGGGGGAGGGTGAAIGSAGSGSGGAGGCLLFSVLVLTKGQAVTVTVGAGGAGGVGVADANGNEGAPGGSTSFGTLLVAPGGSGGRRGLRVFNATAAAGIAGGTGGGNGGGNGGTANSVPSSNGFPGGSALGGSISGAGGGGGSGATNDGSGGARTGGSGGDGGYGLCVVIW